MLSGFNRPSGCSAMLTASAPALTNSNVSWTIEAIAKAPGCNSTTTIGPLLTRFDKSSPKPFTSLVFVLPQHSCSIPFPFFRSALRILALLGMATDFSLTNSDVFRIRSKHVSVGGAHYIYRLALVRLKALAQTMDSCVQSVFL